MYGKRRRTRERNGGESLEIPLYCGAVEQAPLSLVLAQGSTYIALVAFEVHLGSWAEEMTQQLSVPVGGNEQKEIQISFYHKTEAREDESSTSENKKE